MSTEPDFDPEKIDVELRGILPSEIPEYVAQCLQAVNQPGMPSQFFVGAMREPCPALQDVIAQATIEEIEAAHDMRLMLQRLEWCGNPVTGAPFQHCPVCKAEESHFLSRIPPGRGPHKPDCELAALIRRARGESTPE